MRACTHWGLGTPTASQRNIFVRVTIFDCAPDAGGVRTSDLWTFESDALPTELPRCSWPLFGRACNLGLLLSSKMDRLGGITGGASTRLSAFIPDTGEPQSQPTGQSRGDHRLTSLAGVASCLHHGPG